VLPSGGAELVIIGVGFDAGDTVTISVFGSQSLSASDEGGSSLSVPVEQRLGELTASGMGFLADAIEVDLAPGLYGVKAASTGGQVAQAALIVK
jgi:hypothetical protein